MDYPNGFDVPSFPAGKRLAVARVAGVATMIVFLLIIFVCGMLGWAQRVSKVHPFLISVNNVTGKWEIIGHQHSEIKQLSAMQTLQEATVGKFIRNWFLIADKPKVNNAIWQSCNRSEQCNPQTKSGEDDGKCALYCLISDDLYDDFTNIVLPNYQDRARNGETWAANLSAMKLSPIGVITADGGVWQINVQIISSKTSTPIDVLAYAKVSRDMSLYPQTLGFYVTEFDAYKLN